MVDVNLCLCVKEDIALPGNKPIEPMEHHNIGDFFVNRKQIGIRQSFGLPDSYLCVLLPKSISYDLQL